MAGGKNPIINGGFDIWQRGTNIVLGTFSAFTADRWLMNYSGKNTGMTTSRQATGDTTNLPFIQYCARVQRNSGETSTAGISLSQAVETSNTIPYVGKVVTFSFYARRGANFSGASNAMKAALYGGTGTDQNVVSGYTGFNVIIDQSATLTTTWQRFQYTTTINSANTEFSPYFEYVPSGTAGANDYFEITGVQLEVGAVATQFTRAGGTIQGELAACQRYFEQVDIVTQRYWLTGYSINSSGSVFTAPMVSKRSTPTITVTGAGTAKILAGGGSEYTITSYTPTMLPTYSNSFMFQANVSSGTTGGQANTLYASGGAVSFQFSSEL
jgi:hypothetical protein